MKNIPGGWVFPRPFLRTHRRSKHLSHDWFGFHVRLSSEIVFAVFVGGWGLTVGCWIYDVFKKEEVDE